MSLLVFRHRVLKPEWIQQMNERPVIFAMANPVPEIFPDEALAAALILSELVVVTFRIKLIMCWPSPVSSAVP